MADSALLVFDLKDRVIDTIRSVKMLDINKKMNDVEIRTFSNFLNDVREELQTFDGLFDTVKNNSEAEVVVAKLYKRQCCNGVRNLEGTLQSIEETNNEEMTKMFPTILNELLTQFEKYFGELKEKLEKLSTSVINLQQTAAKAIEQLAGEANEYKFVDMVPANPTNIVLDFDENRGTPESDLKKAIFEVNSSGTVTAVARGMGGVGKTCALRGVGKHPDAPGRFPDGILYMSLGAESGKADLIRNCQI